MRKLALVPVLALLFGLVPQAAAHPINAKTITVPPAATPPAPVVPTSCTDSDTAISADQQAWVDKYFVPKVLEYWGSGHPSPEIRTEYTSSKAALESNQTKRVFQDCLFGTTDTVTHTMIGGDGKPVIIWSLAAVMAAKDRLSKDQWADVMLAEHLLAAYKVNAQLAAPRGAFELRANRESEAQWYQAERVIAPMLRAGRLDPFPSNELPFYAAFVAAQGDPRSPAWNQAVAAKTR